MSKLADRKCEPCRGGTPPLGGAELEALARQVPSWNVVEDHHLSKRFRFRNFREAFGFVGLVADLAESQGHHPDVSFGWGWAELVIFTHVIDGLTESDFILAAKIGTL